MNTFKTRLNDLIIEKNVSKRMLAKQIGVSAMSISDWTNGVVQPNSESLSLLANYFNVSADYLLGMEDEFGNKTITASEAKHGATDTTSMKLTPQEQELIFVYRDIGNRHGAEAQNDFIQVGKNLLKL